MSLDELMNLAGEPRDDIATMPIATTTPPAAPTAAPAAAPMPAPLNPATSMASPRPPQPAVATGPDLRERVMSDARRAFDAGLAHGREWLEQGDNALIVATLVAALLLLLVVAAA